VVKETETQILTTTYYSFGIFWCTIFGIAASVIIGQISPLFLSVNSKAIKNSASQSYRGTDSGFLVGLQNAFLSIGLPVALIVAVSILAYFYAGFYGLGMAAVGMLANMGFYNTMSAFAPITDNANTMAIESAMSDDAVKNTRELKLAGLKNLANSRNFMIIASALTSITLLSAFIVHSGIELVNLSKPLVITGILLGAVLPFILSSSVLSSVVKAGNKMITEARRQFTEIPALSEAKEILDKYRGDLTYATEGEKEIVYAAVDDVNHKQLVEISTYSIVWETITIGGISIALIAFLGYFAGIEILAGFLTGLVASGIVLSLFMANTGNTYESTKIAYEEGIKLHGEQVGTGSGGYQTSVITDKAGKQMKDAVSPSIMVIVKLALVAALVLSSALINRELSKKGLHIQNLEKNQIQMENQIPFTNSNTYLM
jgi:K(+)-stimulated pyrophosphate-energized sodium pump